MVFSLGPSSKSHFFPGFIGGISEFLNVFLVLSSGPSPKSHFFFVFLLCFSGFSIFFLVFVFSFFLFSPRGIKQNVSFFLSGVSVVLITIHERVKQTMGSWGG